MPSGPHTGLPTCASLSSAHSTPKHRPVHRRFCIANQNRPHIHRHPEKVESPGINATPHILDAPQPHAQTRTETSNTQGTHLRDKDVEHHHLLDGCPQHPPKLPKTKNKSRKRLTHLRDRHVRHHHLLDGRPTALARSKQQALLVVRHGSQLQLRLAHPGLQGVGARAVVSSLSLRAW